MSVRGQSKLNGEKLALWNLPKQTTETFTATEGTHDHPKPYHEDNPLYIKVLFEDRVVITFRLLSMKPLLEETFVKARCNLKFGDNGHKFADLIPSLVEQQYKALSTHVSSKIPWHHKKNIFVTNATK